MVETSSKVAVFCSYLLKNNGLTKSLNVESCVLLCLTVMTELPVLLGSSLLVAVIVAVPIFKAVTLPFWSTVATSSLEELHVTSLFVALFGKTIKFEVLLGSSSSRYKVTLAGPTLTETTWTTACELELEDELLELLDGAAELEELLGTTLELLEEGAAEPEELLGVTFELFELDALL